MRRPRNAGCTQESSGRNRRIERPTEPPSGNESQPKQGWVFVTALRAPLLIAFKVGLLAVAVVTVVFVARQVERHVRSAEAFATKAIEIAGAERLSESEILDAAGLAIGRNIFELAPEEAESRLLEHSWVAEASVRRRLPDTYTIRIRERRAVALLLMEELYLVSEEGTVFKRVDAEDNLDLPVITGLDRERFTSDRAYRASAVLEVVALMHDYRGAGLWRREPISEVHVEDDDGLSLYVGEDGMHVRLGRGPFRDKLHRLRRVLDRLADEELRAEYIYVDNVRRPDRVTVKLHELPAPLEAIDEIASDAS